MRVHKLIVSETLRRLGAPGLIGGAALLAGLVWALAGVWPAEQNLESMRIRAAEAELRLARVKSGAERAPESSAQQLASFYGALPGQAEATNWIDRIYAAAGEEKLSLAKGEYSVVSDPAGRLARYQIVLPIRGDYLRIRRFVGAVLETVPHLGLEELSFRRQTITETDVEARIRLTLYMTKP